MSWLNTTGSEFLKVNLISLVSAAPAQTAANRITAHANSERCFCIVTTPMGEINDIFKRNTIHRELIIVNRNLLEFI